MRDQLRDRLVHRDRARLSQLLPREAAGEQAHCRHPGARRGRCSPTSSRRPSRRRHHRPSRLPRRRDPDEVSCAPRRQRSSSRQPPRARRAGRGSGRPRGSWPSSPAPLCARGASAPRSGHAPAARARPRRSAPCRGPSPRRGSGLPAAPRSHRRTTIRSTGRHPFPCAGECATAAARCRAGETRGTTRSHGGSWCRRACRRRRAGRREQTSVEPWSTAGRSTPKLAGVFDRGRRVIRKGCSHLFPSG